jgi:hypothetical protein
MPPIMYHVMKHEVRKPFRYLMYAFDYNIDAHFKVFKKAWIQVNVEIKKINIVNLFGFTLKDIVF